MRLLVSSLLLCGLCALATAPIYRFVLRRVHSALSRSATNGDASRTRLRQAAWQDLGHHQAYTDKLNVALRTLRDRGGASKDLVKLGVDTMLARLSDVPEDLRQSIRNNGGGYVNHALYWNCMSPPNTTDGAATGLRVPAEGSKILAAITRDFGSFDAFRTKFTDLATALFGSGWVFLYVDGNTKTLKLMATANQDNPASVEQNAHHVSLLTIDVWEHAYYVDFKNKRADFISQWWSIVNWNKIESNYSVFLAYDTVIREMGKGRPGVGKEEL